MRSESYNDRVRCASYGGTISIELSPTSSLSDVVECDIDRCFRDFANFGSTNLFITVTECVEVWYLSTFVDTQMCISC